MFSFNMLEFPGVYASLEVRLEQHLDPSASTQLKQIKDMKQTPYPQAREHPTFFGIHFGMLWFQEMESKTVNL